MNQFILGEIIISLCALIVGVLIIVLRTRKGIGYTSTVAYAICLTLGAISLFAISQVKNPQTITVLKIVLYIILAYLPVFIFTYIWGLLR